MTPKKWETCWECKKEMERCRAVTVNEFGRIEYVCRRCWKELDYDKHLYEHRQGNQ